jgi:hypothetical protein
MKLSNQKPQELSFPSRLIHAAKFGISSEIEKRNIRIKFMDLLILNHIRRQYLQGSILAGVSFIH